jgi:hypothetical protein
LSVAGKEKRKTNLSEDDVGVRGGALVNLRAVDNDLYDKKEEKEKGLGQTRVPLCILKWEKRS